VLDELSEAELIDWSRGCVDRCRCGRRGRRTDRAEPHRPGKPETKYHLLCERNGLPLHLLITGANTHDSKLSEPLQDTNPPSAVAAIDPVGPVGGPEKLHADRA
jgi:hypothetical protein